MMHRIVLKTDLYRLIDTQMTLFILRLELRSSIFLKSTAENVM